MTIKTSSTPSYDTLRWLPEKSGRYSTKTGYGIGMLDKGLDRDAPQPIEWLKHLWNVRTSPKIKDFLWKVIRKAIPVSENLEIRGITAFACKKCGAPESDTHVFLKCPVAEEVWSLLPLSMHPPTSLSSLPELLKSGTNYRPLPPTGLVSPLWPWVVWSLWKARNKLVFENRVFSAP